MLTEFVLDSCVPCGHQYSTSICLNKDTSYGDRTDHANIILAWEQQCTCCNSRNLFRHATLLILLAGRMDITVTSSAGGTCTSGDPTGKGRVCRRELYTRVRERH